MASCSPYLYFKAVAGLYGTVNAANKTIAYSYWTQPSNTQKITAYKDSTAWGPTPYNPSVNAYAWENSTNYQLLCPGLDGIYGKQPSGGGGPPGPDPQDGTNTNLYAPLYPVGSNYDPTNGLDDMTNFTKGQTVGNDTQ